MEQLDIRDYEFSEEEILNELNRLGYHNVPRSKLKEFQRDLKVLIQNDKSTSVNESLSSAYSPDTESSPPIHIRIGPSKDSDERREELDKGYTRAQSSRGYQTHEGKSPIRPGDLSDTDSDLPRMVKRKTMRKNDEGARFIDESMTESDAGSVIDAHERLQRMRLKDFDDLPTSRSSRCSHRDVEEPPYRLSADDPRPASVILRPSGNPHTKNLRKSDPVARYQQFKEVWQSHRAPGERDHKNLRWNIRERMLAQEVPEKKNHRVYVQNKYVIPSEKQRKSLRWQVRTEMAQGIKPACGFFHEF